LLTPWHHQWYVQEKAVLLLFPIFIGSVDYRANIYPHSFKVNTLHYTNG